MYFIYSHECSCCGIGREFSSKEEVDNYKCPCKDKKPLLTIELQDETSVPKVFYKGEEVKLKQEVQFHWETDTDEYGGLSYAIEHAVEGKSHPTRNRIERRVKGHALI